MIRANPAKISLQCPITTRDAVRLKAELGQAIPRDQFRAFHRKSAGRHFLVAIRQFAILGLASWALITFEHPLIWIPLAFVQGFTIFNFTILLHEVLHHNVFEQTRPLATRILGLLYATPSGIFGQPVHALAPRSPCRARV